jgi:DHA2 family multidrug resistance protein
MPLSQTLLLTIFPKKLQPAAMGIWAITTLVAPVAGPMLGGTLCDNFGWGSIFLVNVPVAIGAGFLVWRVLFSQETKTTKARVDTVGLGLLVVWVGALQLMLDLGKENEWFSSPLIVTLGLVALLGFIAFLIWELTDSNPIVDLRVFRYRSFSIGMVCMALMIGSFFAINVIGPLWLQNNLGWTASWAGNATGMVGVLAIFAAPIAAQLAVKVDPRRLIFLGVGWLAIITFIRGLSTMDMSFGQIAFLIFLTGVGMPFFFMPLLQITMGAVKPEETANAAGLQNFIRTMSGAVATSFVLTIWENGATSNRAEMVNGIDGAQSVQLLTQHGVSPDAAVGLFDRLVSAQALMISTNSVFMGAAVLFALCALIVWIVPRPKGPVDMSNVH